LLSRAARCLDHLRERAAVVAVQNGDLFRAGQCLQEQVESLGVELGGQHIDAGDVPART